MSIERNTHLIDWLNDGWTHCQHGTRGWCENYLHNARDVIKAQDDELSRLREVERNAKALANAFYVFTIEDDDGIRLSTGGMVVAHYSEHSPEGIALLKLDAAARALSEREGQE